MNEETITSRQNSLVKEVCSLLDKKARRESRLFRFDGTKLLGEALSSGLEVKYAVFNYSSERAVEYIKRHCRSLEEKGVRVVAVSESVFEKMSEERAPEGVISVAKMPDGLHEELGGDTDIPTRGESLLILESLRDPANLGTVMRSAYALGIDRIIMTDDCADLYNSKTLRAAMGAAFKMPTLKVRANELDSFILKLREGGRRVFAAALSDSPIDLSEIKLERGDCFVIGNEGHGLSQKVIDACTASVIIPMREGAESLNAAAAAAICIWETVRAAK